MSSTRETQHRAAAAGRLSSLCLCLCLWAAPAAAAQPDAQPAECEIHYRITPLYDARPRALEVRLSFPAQARAETFLRAEPAWAGVNDYAAAYGGWDGVSRGARVSPAELPNRWRVQHAAGGRVEVRYTVRSGLQDPDDGKPQDQTEMYRVQVGADWFQFVGHAALVSVENWDDNTEIGQCVTIVQPGDDAPAFSGLGHGRGREVTMAWHGSPATLRHGFYAGGPGWRVTRRALPTGEVFTAQRGRFAISDAAFADAVGSLIDRQRRFWGSEREPAQWVVLTPNHQADNYGGTLVHRVAVLHAGPGFNTGVGAFEFLVAHENLHQWLPDRFGPRREGDDAEVQDYWFSEGFTDYYTHRLLLSSGLWNLDDYARALTQAAAAYLQSPARNAGAQSIAPRFFSDRDAGRQMYLRGEFLAMRWDRALRQAGHPGLDDVLRALMLPPGATSVRPADGARALPTAPDRLLAALRPWLGAVPAAEVQRHITEGASLAFEDGMAGPCLALRTEKRPAWSLGFDRASFEQRVAVGVDPQGPAYRAGLRDGMKLEGWSVWGGDTDRDVELNLVGVAEPMRYLPRSATAHDFPVWEARPGALADAACKAWIR